MLLFSAAISGALTLIMVLFLRAHREHAGFARWTAASAMVSLSFLFSGLRDLIPMVVSVIGVNLGALAATPMYLDGTRRFFGLDPRTRGWYAGATAAFAASMYCLFVWDDIVARTMILMVACALPLAATAVLALRRRPSRRSVLGTALALQLLLITAAMLARAVWVTRQSEFSMLSESPAQYLFFGGTLVLHMGIIITFVLMTTERVAEQLSGAGVELAARVEQLERTLGEVKTLRGLLPICASCKRIRDDGGAWIQMEVYVRDRSQAEFSHGLCPECLPKYLSMPPRAPRA